MRSPHVASRRPGLCFRQGLTSGGLPTGLSRHLASQGREAPALVPPRLHSIDACGDGGVYVEVEQPGAQRATRFESSHARMSSGEYLTARPNLMCGG